MPYKKKKSEVLPFALFPFALFVLTELYPNTKTETKKKNKVMIHWFFFYNKSNTQYALHTASFIIWNSEL